MVRNPALKMASIMDGSGINSVHTYAAHKAVHTMAMAQQQHSISSSSSSFSATPSSTTPSLSVVENSSISLTPRKEAALTSSSPHKRSLGSLTPAVVPALAACMSVASPSKDYKIEGARESGSSGGGGRNKERERCEGDREGGDIRSFTISRSDSKSSHDGCRHDHKAKLSTVAATASSTPHKSISTAANLAVSAIPAANFILSPTSSRTLTSSPISTSSALRLNPTPATALGVAMSTNPLLAAGLSLSALQPGIGTPTGSLGGLVSPILFGNNPFLTVLGASPMTLPKTVAAMTTTKASAMGRVLDTTAAEVAAAQFVPSQQTAGVTQNLQLISQLNDKINAQLRMAPGNGCITIASATQMDFNRLLSLAGTGASTLQATAAYSANSGLDPEFSKRERQLEMLMSKTPIHCIAPPPEILSSMHDRLTTEHTIEYIDTLRLKMSNSTKEKKNGISATSSLDERLTTSSERSNSNSSLRDIRNSKDSEELRVDTDEVLVETPSPSRSKLELSKLPKKESNLSASKRSRSMDSLSRSTSNSSLSVVAAVNVVDTASQSLHQLARTNTTTATAAPSLSSGISSLVGSTSVLTAPSLTPTSSLPSSISIPPSLPASVAPLAVSIPPAAATPLPGGFPLLYTVPPTTATGGHMHGLSPSLLSPSPLKGYYVVYNPLAGAVAAGAGGVVTGNHGSTAAVQPFAVIPPQAVSTTNKISNTVQSATAAATETVPLQVSTGLMSATGLIPSLGAASLGSVSSPMYYYVPDGSYLNAASGSGLMAATVGAKEEGVVGKRTHVHHQHHRGVSSLVEGSMKAKKRQRSDCTEVVTTEAKRMRTNTSDVSWRGELKHRVGSSEDVEVVSEEEHVDVGLGVAKDDFTDSDDEGSGAEGFLMHSADGNKSYTYKTHLQLWEFLLDLLLTPNHGTIIQWTGNDYEFNIVNPEAVVRLWGAHKNKPQMTYEKMSRSLRYYYSQGIMDKVPGKRFTFKFAFDIQKYIIDNKKTSLFTLTS